MIRTVCVASDEELQRNHENAVSQGYPWLAPSPETDEPLAIVGGGYSAGTYLQEILGWSGKVMALNGAYDWLFGKGLIADYCFMIDPQEHVAEFAEFACHPTEFLLGTCCHPAVFSALEGQRIRIFEVQQAGGDMEAGKIPGGCSAMTRAPLVAAYMGFRDITLFGADCCYRPDVSHVYGHTQPSNLHRILCDGREWVTELGYLAQAEYLAEMVPAFPFPVRVVGDSLATAMIRTNQWSEIYAEPADR